MTAPPAASHAAAAAPAVAPAAPAHAEAIRAELGRAAPDGDPGAVLAAMRRRLEGGRAAVRARFEAGGSAEAVHRELAAQMDGLVQGALDHADRHVYRRANPTTGERLAVVAVGGYGRGELAPASDVDLLFLHAYKRSAYVEQVAEFLLYKLWDLRLKVGQATRSVAECVKLGRADPTVRTALLEARPLWGDPALFDRFRRAQADAAAADGVADFVEAKLRERDERHAKAGDSRYLLEPNIKEGRGGLRDLQTLVWLARAAHPAVAGPDDLAAHGVLTADGQRRFLRCRHFLWTVRCHLHYATGRAEERLTYDLQPEVARAMGYRDRPRSLGVERFMKRTYLIAKDVGAITRAGCAAIEERHRRKGRFILPRLPFGRRRVNGFEVEGGRLRLGERGLFERRPAAALELFRVAQERELEVDAEALAAVQAALRRVDAAVRADPEANRTFLEILCARSGPGAALSAMNECGLLGRFVPDFARIVGQTQHGLYHRYTVDEHTIRAVGVLSQVEQGELAAEVPLSTEILPQLASRRELYLATFLHDIGKGRGGDHSRIGAGIAARLCRRFGLAEAPTETVAWLVAHHLLLSATAFRRDSEDPETVRRLVEVVQSPERLRLLLVLTTVDIRAVGPSVWNGWKGQLLRELYHEAAAAMAASGDPRGRRRERAEAARRALAERLAAGGGAAGGPPWPEAAVRGHLARLDLRYWIGFGPEDHARHAGIVRRADAAGAKLALDFRVDRFRARTEVVLYAADHPGLFMKVAGALAVSGASIVDARIFTTADGTALDVFGIQDAARRGAVEGPERHRRIAENVERALRGELWLERALEGRRSLPPRADVFRVEPRVLVDNGASRTHSVVEVNGRDRPGLLFDLAKALKDLGLVVSSAHISTYGERVVDVFYVKDVFGLKVTQRSKLARVERRLLDALAEA